MTIESAGDDPESAARVLAMHQADVAARQLGVELESAAVGRATVVLEVVDAHTGSLGQVHGGVLFTLADVAMSYASNSHGGTSVATHAAIDYVSAASVGDRLIAEAVEHSRRGKAGIYDVTVHTATDARLVATFRGNTLQIR